MVRPASASSVRFHEADCEDPKKLSKLLQALTQGSFRAVQSAKNETQRVANQVSIVQSGLNEIVDRGPNPVLRTIEDVDLTSTGNHILFTASRGRYVVTNVIVRYNSIDTVTDGPSVSVGTGTTGSDATNIFPESELYAATISSGKGWQLGDYGSIAILGYGSTAYLNTSAGATATALTADIDILGYRIQ